MISLIQRRFEDNADFQLSKIMYTFSVEPQNLPQNKLTSKSRSVRFCTVDELKEKRVVTRWDETFRDEITVTRAEDTLLAFSTVCPHHGGPVRKTENSHWRCQWHHWEFDAESGECISNESNCRLAIYSATIVENKWIEIQRYENC